VKGHFVWIVAFLVPIASVIAACGSTGGSQYSVTDGGPDGMNGADTGHLMFGDSGGDGHRTSCIPLTCEKLGYNCGPAGDGCGG